MVIGMEEVASALKEVVMADDDARDDIQELPRCSDQLIRNAGRVADHMLSLLRGK